MTEINRVCADLIELKGIDWRGAARTFFAEAKKVQSDEEHLVLLVRMLARLKDGHAAVRPLEKGKHIKWPDQKVTTGPGMFWCKSGDKLLVKNSWSSAKSAGVTPGMEIVKVDQLPALEWLSNKITEVSDQVSFSTAHQALFYTCHWGLSEAPGTEMKLELRDLKGRRKKVEFRYTKANPVPMGPAFYPTEVNGGKDVKGGVTKAGWGYIHIRRCPGDLPRQMDAVLASIGKAPGLILDFRGNSGGGFDHSAFMGRFVPKGEQLSFAKRYESAGSHPYGGPVVVIVDATVRSAGETAAAIFKEDGRAYVIGESPTAGMSSTKKTIDLPSGLFSLYVSVGSNMSRSNDGKGLEGVGVIPHEVVAFDAEDLANGTDTLIKIAEQRLKKFPKDKVPYSAKGQ